MRRTEREFYAGETASRYSAAVSTSLQTVQVIDGNWPYRTCVITRTVTPGRSTAHWWWNGPTWRSAWSASFVFNEAHEYLLPDVTDQFQRGTGTLIHGLPVRRVRSAA